MKSSTNIPTLIHILSGQDQVCEHCLNMELDFGHGNSSMNRGICLLGLMKKKIGHQPWADKVTTLNYGCRKFEARS